MKELSIIPLRKHLLLSLFALIILSPVCFAKETVAPSPFYTLDLTALHRLNRADQTQARRAWDTLHLVASVQGIVNRDGPVLFIRFNAETDDFWLNHLRSKGNWLAGRQAIPLKSTEHLLRTFAKELRGVVLYKEEVAATSNLASTIAGVEDRACLRYDPAPESVYSTILALDLPFTRDALRLFRDDGSPLFTGKGTIPDTQIASTGSPKADAYLWAKARYLDTAKCGAKFMAYYIDAYWLRRPTVSGLNNSTLTNHDFFISKKAFFFDLHVWKEEAPIDDSAQKPGTDLGVLRRVMRSMYDRADGKIFQIGGFTPWAWKYTDHPGAGGKHGGVDTEWEYGRIISQYNGVMDADALGFSGMANASFYTHFPLKKRYPQNPKPTIASLKKDGLIRDDGSVASHAFIGFYMGDYDSAAWLQIHVPKWWSDPARLRIPCSWAFNPNLDQRAPHVLDYVRSNQSPNDWFISGDSGAGYLNPGNLSAKNRREAGTPGGWGAWVRHNKNYFKRYDLSITGFVIDGHAPGMGTRGLDAYAKFSPDGIVGQKIPRPGLHRDQMPYVHMAADLTRSPEDAGDRIASTAGKRNAPRFLFYRTILKSPSWHEAAMKRATAANPNVRFVDPYTFFLLFKTYKLQSQ